MRRPRDAPRPRAVTVVRDSRPRLGLVQSDAQIPVEVERAYVDLGSCAFNVACALSGDRELAADAFVAAFVRYAGHCDGATPSRAKVLLLRCLVEACRQAAPPAERDDRRTVQRVVDGRVLSMRADLDLLLVLRMVADCTVAEMAEIVSLQELTVARGLRVALQAARIELCTCDAPAPSDSA